MKKLDRDRIVHNTIQAVTERAEKAESELAELREKIAWHFECLAVESWNNGRDYWNQDAWYDSADELYWSTADALEQLRGESK